MEYAWFYILWALGHIGLEVNEATDELARKSVEMPLIGRELLCGIGEGFMFMNGYRLLNYFHRAQGELA